MKKKTALKPVDQVNLKILNELINFCMHHGGSHISMTMKNYEHEMVIEVSTEIFNMDDKVITTLRKYLNTPRQHEVESYYWELSGEDDADSELTLVGMMSDEAEVNYQNDNLHIKVIRKK